MNIVFLISGNGGNYKFFQFLYENKLIKNGINLIPVLLKNSKCKSFLKNKNIDFVSIDYSKANPNQLHNILEQIKPNLVISTWNKIIDNQTIEMMHDKIINLHYSLLPAFKGLIKEEPLKRAYLLNCQFIGSTVHYLEEEVDGGKIISQFVTKKSGNFNNDLEVIFQNSCILLLNTVHFLLDNKVVELPEATIKQDNFNPELSFDINYFDNNFWKKFKDYV